MPIKDRKMYIFDVLYAHYIVCAHIHVIVSHMRHIHIFKCILWKKWSGWYLGIRIPFGIISTRSFSENHLTNRYSYLFIENSYTESLKRLLLRYTWATLLRSLSESFRISVNILNILDHFKIFDFINNAWSRISLKRRKNCSQHGQKV